MNSLVEQLKAKQSAVTGGSAEAPELVLNSAATEENNLNNAPDDAPADLAPTTLVTAFAEAASYSPKAGDYKAIRLHSVVSSKGVRTKPNKYGYFEQPSGEIKEQLEYFAKKGLVALVTE